MTARKHASKSKRSTAIARRSRSAETEAKGLTFTPQFLGWEFFRPGLPGSTVDYATEVHNGMQSSVVTSALCWMMRTFPEAPVVVQRETTDDKWKTVHPHPLSQLLKRPNPQYGGIVLWQSTIMDYCFGEAYWLKVRDGNGKLVELWWIPRGRITPIPNPATGMLLHYQYTPVLGALEILEPNDVAHFRFGQHPNNILRGFSPLASVMREVYTDDQAANFTAAILKNFAVMGVILSPKTGMIQPDQLQKLKDDVQQKFTGDKRGSVLFMNGPMDVQLLQYNMQGFNVGPVRDIAEERVCAALGIPAAVIGFGTGLQQTKVGATMREMVKLAWQGGIEPNQRAIADEMDRSLLPEFHVNDSLFRTHFDTSQVEALTESPTEKVDRVIKQVQTNLQKINDGQRELQLAVDPAMDKYDYQIEPKKTLALPAYPTPPSNRVASQLGAEEEGAGTESTGTGKSASTTINVAPTPVNLALTIEAPRTGTKKRSGTFEKKADGRTVIEMIEETIEEHTNGDGKGDGSP